MQFPPFPKIPRLSREIIVTEKIDGTNASIFIEDAFVVSAEMAPYLVAEVEGFQLYAGSRTRWITPTNDNEGFAGWVKENATDLVKLGTGHHFGEWWGKKIQRHYGLDHRRFSLFNTTRWEDKSVRPECCHVVPVLYQGDFSQPAIENAIMRLEQFGSFAAQGYMNPEGIIIFHTTGNLMFKKTIKDDDKGKGHEGNHQQGHRDTR